MLILEIMILALVNSGIVKAQQVLQTSRLVRRVTRISTPVKQHKDSILKLLVHHCRLASMQTLHNQMQAKQTIKFILLHVRLGIFVQQVVV